jgi:hypothetical protein
VIVCLVALADVEEVGELAAGDAVSVDPAEDGGLPTSSGAAAAWPAETTSANAIPRMSALTTRESVSTRCRSLLASRPFPSHAQDDPSRMHARNTRRTSA